MARQQSSLSEYIKKEALLKQLQEELLTLESNENLKKEIEFKEKLDKLIVQYNSSNSEVIGILDPSGTFSGNPNNVLDGPTASGKRRKRKMKIYKNPHTGEVVETRGGNHKTLKAWKDEHGSDVVESWVTEKID